MTIKDKLSITLPRGIRPFIRGLVITYFLIAIFSLIVGLVFYFTPLSEMWMHPISAAITTLALFFGGRAAAKSAGHRGLFHGLIIGIFFIVITVFFSLSKDISWSALAIKSAYALVASVVGGISGVK